MAQETKIDFPIPPQTTEMITFTLDGRQLTVPKGTTVLQAAIASGITVPFFCWHPKLKPVGACRMCYVEIEKMNKLQVSCATEVSNGMVVHSSSDMVKQGRKAVIEFTLINHPLDCPTCDKGGECDLQNLTFAHGFDDSRFAFSKMRKNLGAERSTFDDKRIGPEIVLNRNRCILCYKCVRANKEAFGEYDLGAYERGNITEIDAEPGGAVVNPFSGNLVEICPVGALTNTDWRYKIRVWLTKTTQSIDPFGSSGANILFYKEDHKNHIYRTTGRRNDTIDDGWIADVTRYGYQIVHSPNRLKTPLIKKNGKQVEATWEEALGYAQKRLSEIKEKKGGSALAGLVSPSLDIETLFSFSKLMRSVLKTNNVDYRIDYRQLPTGDSLFSTFCEQPFKIADIATSDVIVTFGSDLHREHPNEYLHIRKARNFAAPRIYTMNPYTVKSSDIADTSIVYTPGTDEAVISGICLAAAEENLGQNAAAVKGKLPFNSIAEAAEAAGVAEDSLRYVARGLAQGKKITFIIGELITRSSARESIAAALANLNQIFGITNHGQMAVLARYSNSVGAQKLGLVTNDGLTTDGIFAAMKKDEINGCVIIGTDPVSMYPDRHFAKEALDKTEFVVAADMFETPTTVLADVVLPLASWAEADGHFINLEGRMQKANRAIRPLYQAKPGSELLSDLATLFGTALFTSDTERKRQMEVLLSNYQTPSLPSSVVEVKASVAQGTAGEGLPLFIVDDAHHFGYITEHSESLTNFASEGYAEISASFAKKQGIKAGDTLRLESATGKIHVKAKVSRTLTSDVVLVPRNFSACPANQLVEARHRVDWVKISKVDG